MQAETELYWRREEAVLHKMNQTELTSYTQATRNAHIMESQYIIRSIVILNIFFALLLIYDVFHSNTTILSNNRLLPCICFLTIPTTLYYYGREIYQLPGEKIDPKKLILFYFIVKCAFILSILLTTYTGVIFIYYNFFTTPIISAMETPISQFEGIFGLEYFIRQIELFFIPILSLLSLVSLFRALTTTTHLQELLSHGHVAYPVKGCFTNPEY
jgi:hypothetical protein